MRKELDACRKLCPLQCLPDQAGTLLEKDPSQAGHLWWNGCPTTTRKWMNCCFRSVGADVRRLFAAADCNQTIASHVGSCEAPHCKTHPRQGFACPGPHPAEGNWFAVPGQRWPSSLTKHRRPTRIIPHPVLPLPHSNPPRKSLMKTCKSAFISP
jgi:hypothetical protein